jgi:hypothetical protein
MALRAKINGRVRVISKAMARRFRARGVEVIDTEAVVKVDPPLSEQQQPPPPVTIEPPADASSVVESSAALTDDELERLTAAEAAPVAAPAVDIAPVRHCSVCGEPGHTKRSCPVGNASGE